MSSIAIIIKSINKYHFSIFSMSPLFLKYSILIHIPFKARRCHILIQNGIYSYWVFIGETNTLYFLESDAKLQRYADWVGKQMPSYTHNELCVFHWALDFWFSSVVCCGEAPWSVLTGVGHMSHAQGGLGVCISVALAWGWVNGSAVSEGRPGPN